MEQSVDPQVLAGMLGIVQALAEQVEATRNFASEARVRAERESAQVSIVGQKAANDWLRLSGAVGAYAVVLDLLTAVQTELLKELESRHA